MILEKWTITDEDDNTVLGALSLVSEPATKSDFKLLAQDSSTAIDYKNLTDDEWATMFFEEQLVKDLEVESSITGEVNKELASELEGKNLIATPILIPNKPIKRVDDVTGKVTYGFFDRDSVRNGAYKFQRLGRQSNFNVQHDPNAFVPGVTLAESWIVDNPYADKSNDFGYLMNRGSWFGILEVKNQQLYDEYLTTGLLKGVSVEASTRDQIIL